MLDYKGKFCPELLEAFTAQGYTINPNGFEVLIYNEAVMQAIIDSFPEPMPDLWPVQFRYMLNKYGFNEVIASLLADLKIEDKVKFDMYDAYLNSARFYEFDRALIMFNEIRDKFTSINSTLNFTDEQLKMMWLDVLSI